MKIALSVWNGRIAPHFEASRMIWIYQWGLEEFVNPSVLGLPEGESDLKLQFLADQDIHVLICGGISRIACRTAVSLNIQVYPFIAGEKMEVLHALKKGELIQTRFSMPGCSCSSRRGWGCHNLKKKGKEI